MRRNEIIAQNIARGFDCHGDCDDAEDCQENGCAQLRSDIVAALDKERHDAFDMGFKEAGGSVIPLNRLPNKQ